MILITGGLGYIGSHTIIELYTNGHEVIVYDNLDNSSINVIERVQNIIKDDIIFIEGDIRDKNKLTEVFEKYNISSVIHFAGLKSVGESVNEPLKYYDNNVNGSMVLFSVMKKYKCKNIVFSSSATVYGDPSSVPIKEDFPVGLTTNPYGTSKYIIERILEDLYISDNEWNITILRYFNPIGAHKSGLLGDNPNGIPNNLMPYIVQVASGEREYLNIFGDDYDTHDGTGIRDYIHVIDLADAHVKAIENMNKLLILNIGTGNGYSVLDVLKTFETINKIIIPYKIVPRRPGDIAECYASNNLAKEKIGWVPKRNLDEMCKDAWNNSLL